MDDKGVILYIGGFELPDRNAAAQRVIGIAKGLRELGYEVVFLNSIKNSERSDEEIKTYFGFKCYEYGRESEKDYLFSAKTTLEHIIACFSKVIYLYANDEYTLEYVSNMCGNKNVDEKLITPTELKLLKTFECIILKSRHLPFKSKLLPFYQYTIK